MKLVAIQHVRFEGPARVGIWAESRGHDLETVRVFAGDPLPGPSDCDGIVIMGGPMSVNDSDTFPWIAGEAELIRKAAGTGTKVLGICLGAQLIASALGSRVYKNADKEIGWYPIEYSGAVPRLFPSLRQGGTLTVFHWHGETFDLPEGAVRLFSSSGCANQAFVLGGNVLALQFHFEMSHESIAALVGNCGDELVSGEYVSDAETITEGAHAHLERNGTILNEMLDAFFS
jgi:GMP synthase-like glutamine amidotransferase